MLNKKKNFTHEKIKTKRAYRPIYRRIHFGHSKLFSKPTQTTRSTPLWMVINLKSRRDEKIYNTFNSGLLNLLFT